MERFIFLTNNESIKSKVLSGVVPAGYYDIQQEFNGDQWVTTYRYYELDPELDSPETVGPWIDQFRPDNFRISEAGALSIIVEE